MVQQLAQLAPTKRVTKHNGADDAKRKTIIIIIIIIIMQRLNAPCVGHKDDESQALAHGFYQRSILLRLPIFVNSSAS